MISHNLGERLAFCYEVGRRYVGSSRVAARPGRAQGVLRAKISTSSELESDPRRRTHASTGDCNARGCAARRKSTSAALAEQRQPARSKSEGAVSLAIRLSQANHSALDPAVSASDVHCSTASHPQCGGRADIAPRPTRTRLP
ncbi:hypothetical protein PSPO01_06356 [Paraphaeosphaeria sporulosa]